MNIDFNSFFRLRVDVTKVPTNDQFQLTMETIDLEDTFHSNRTSYFMNRQQLQQFVDYIQESIK